MYHLAFEWRKLLWNRDLGARKGTISYQICLNMTQWGIYSQSATNLSHLSDPPVSIPCSSADYQNTCLLQGHWFNVTLQWICSYTIRISESSCKRFFVPIILLITDYWIYFVNWYDFVNQNLEISLSD